MVNTRESGFIFFQDLLQTATLLGVDEIIEACSNFMSSHLSEENVVTVWLFAESINCIDLMGPVHHYFLSLLNVKIDETSISFM